MHLTSANLGARTCRHMQHGDQHAAGHATRSGAAPVSHTTASYAYAPRSVEQLELTLAFAGHLATVALLVVAAKVSPSPDLARWHTHAQIANHTQVARQHSLNPGARARPQAMIHTSAHAQLLTPLASAFHVHSHHLRRKEPMLARGCPACT